MCNQSPRPGTDRTTVDLLMSALASETRRLVLASFEESTEKTASLDDLAEDVSVNQDGTDTLTRDQIRQRLHHVDLPKLATVGLVDYDARTNTVRYWGPPDVVEDDVWSRLVTG